MYNTILFDLDGTLTDPEEGITKSVAYALSKFGITVEDRSELYKFIGPPLADAFMRYYNFTEEQAKEAVVYYRERFKNQGIYENKLYDGVPEMLQRIKESGKTVALATSKPEPFAKVILDHFDIAKYFDFVGGATFDGTRSKKGDVVSYVLSSLQIDDKTKTVMVGDREHDVFGAKQNGIDSIGVLYGYGGIDELRGAGATHIAKSVEELTAMIVE